MPLFEWNEQFNVGVEYFNAQHKNLVTLVNDLHDAMREGKSSERLGGILAGLIDYTVRHFTDEERAMARYGYGDLAVHHHEHELLTAKVLEYKKRFEEKQVLLSIELAGFLKDWLTNHIMETDKRYGPFLAGREIP